MNNSERFELRKTSLAEERMSEPEKKASQDKEYYQKRWKEAGLRGELYLDTAGNGVEYIFGNINGQDIYLCKKQGSIDGRSLTEEQVYAIYAKYADLVAPTKNMKQAEKEIIEALRKQPRTEEEILQKKKEEEVMMQKEAEGKKREEELEEKKTQMMVDRILRS